MRTLHWNGERWYVNQQSAWKRVRRWFVWVGGWERANGEGWQFRTPYLGRHLWHSPTPVSVFGHRATFYGHWLQVRVSSGWLVVNFRERYAFISANGTPNQAHCWLWGLYAKNWNLPDEARQLVLTPEQRADVA
jgi:hypothetical protein